MVSACPGLPAPGRCAVSPEVPPPSLAFAAQWSLHVASGRCQRRADWNRQLGGKREVAAVGGGPVLAVPWAHRPPQESLGPMSVLGEPPDWQDSRVFPIRGRWGRRGHAPPLGLRPDSPRPQPPMALGAAVFLRGSLRDWARVGGAGRRHLWGARVGRTQTRPGPE